MSVGNLIIDKASVDMNYLLKSLKIVYDNGGKITRYDFVRKMELYMNGKIVSQSDEIERSRTQFNKTKLARYYGLLRTIKDIDNQQYLIITKRGKEICSLVEERSDNNFVIKNKDKFQKIILYSILYDTFGKNNDGVETSNSDLEPPKILLKSIYLCKYITSREFIYLLYTLNNLYYSSYEDAIKDILILRTNGNESFMDDKIKEYQKTNFVTDNKLISFFYKIGIIERDGEKYEFNVNFLNNYKDIIQQLNPVSKNLQLIISGASGVGKSYFINNVILGNIVENSQIIRTFIHQEYSYSDFIGYIKPQINNGKISYIFEPGPFTIALERALKNPKKNYYLVIEEMNRGNITSIFGDIFQLLDRVDDFKLNIHNKSRYSIENYDINRYLRDSIGFRDSEIYLPTNLNIIGTLNTSNKNTYMLDTAFKRRFNYLNIKISLEDKDDEESYLYKIDEKSKKNIFNDNHTWTEFVEYINNIIDIVNKDFYTIPEEKKLAQYFVNLEDLENKESFCDKVIYYLKNDVFRYNKVIREQYEDIRKKVILGYDIFELIGVNDE